MNASERPASAVPSADLRARILAEAAKTPAPTRKDHRLRIGLLSTVGAVMTSALFFGMGGVVRGSRPMELIAFTVGAALFGALVLTRVSGGTGGSMLGRPRPVLLLAAVIGAPLLACFALAAATLWPEQALEDVPGHAHLACGVITLAQGAIPLVLLVWPRRGTDPVHPALTGAALGMAAGAWTAMMAALRCPHVPAAHCIIAHVLPTVILTALGAVLGHILLRVR